MFKPKFEFLLNELVTILFVFSHPFTRAPVVLPYGNKGTLVNRLIERGLPLRNYFYAFKLQKLK